MHVGIIKKVSMKPGRSDPCPCGSGKAFEKCCQEWYESAKSEPFGKREGPAATECSQLVALLNAGHLAELESRTHLLLEQYPDSGFAWNLLGVSLQRQSRDGLPAFQKAVKFLPNDAEVHNNLGNALSDSGRLDEAEAIYRLALQINPRNSNAYNNLGCTLSDLGRLDEAEASYRRALQVKPDFAEAHFNLGSTLNDLGRLDEAEASYRRALQIKPDFAKAHFKMGSTLNDLGRLDEAEASYRRALQIKPDFAEAHFDLGNILGGLGRLGEAEASYRLVLEIKPDIADVYGNLGGVLMGQGKQNEALACFQQQIKLTPWNGTIMHLIASLTGNNTERAPIQYVENLFDDYADKFDTLLQKKLKYEIPEKLVALVTQHLMPPTEKWNVLDVGCGTGLVGSAIAPFTRQLVGVDLSAKMLEKAHVRNLYQRLERLDLLTMMRGEKASIYDVIIAADVFIYIGKLDEIIGEIKRLLRPGGVLAFSIEALAALANDESIQGDQREYQLEKTGRYTQSVSYITRLASANGFMPQAIVETQIRMERGKPIKGYLVLWRN